MIEIKVDEKRQELEEKIRIFKKNDKALWDLLTLYNYIKEKRDDLSLYTLFEIVIKDLEDKEVDIPLKTKSIDDLIKQNRKEFKDLQILIAESKYKDSYDDFRRDYRAGLIEAYYHKLDEPFNFLVQLGRYSPDFLSEFLISNIPISKRVSYLYEMIKFLSASYFSVDKLAYLLKPTGSGISSLRTTYEEKEKKIVELISAFHDTINKGEKKIELLKYIINGKDSLHWFCFLQENKIINFMDLCDTVTFDKNKFDVSVCTYLNLTKLENFLQFYQLEDYLKVPKTIRENDDIVILENISIADLSQFISLSHFEITEDKVKRIASKVFTYQQENDEILDDNFMNLIMWAIIKKAESTKIAEEFAKIFTDLSDYRKYKEEQEKIQLDNARLSFLIRLHNMGESLEKQVPKETLIRSLDFYKKISR